MPVSNDDVALALQPTIHYGDIARLAGLRAMHEKTPQLFNLPDVADTSDYVRIETVKPVPYKQYLNDIIQLRFRKVASILQRNTKKAYDVKDICSMLHMGLSSYEKLENMKQVRKILEYIGADVVKLICADLGDRDAEGNPILVSGTFYYAKEPNYEVLFSIIE